MQVWLMSNQVWQGKQVPSLFVVTEWLSGVTAYQFSIPADLKAAVMPPGYMLLLGPLVCEGFQLKVHVWQHLANVAVGANALVNSVFFFFYIFVLKLRQTVL